MRRWSRIEELAEQPRSFISLAGALPCPSLDDSSVSTAVDTGCGGEHARSLPRGVAVRRPLRRFAEKVAIGATIDDGALRTASPPLAVGRRRIGLRCEGREVYEPQFEFTAHPTSEQPMSEGTAKGPAARPRYCSELPQGSCAPHPDSGVRPNRAQTPHRTGEHRLLLQVLYTSLGVQ
jgi:hypothetical protein